MKVLHLLASPVFSGPAESIALLAQAQRDLGHDVRVAVDRKRGSLGSEEPAAPRLAAQGLLDEGGLELCVKSLPWRALADVLTLRSRTDLEVVHAHFSHDHLLARWGTPRGAALIRSIHAPRSLRWSLPRADAFTTFDAFSARRLAPRTVALLPALVDPAFVPAGARAVLRSELGWSGDPLVGMTSTFQSSRRHALALEAFAALRQSRPDAHLVLVGDGPLEESLRAQVHALRLDRAITFAGYRNGQEFVRCLQSLDALWVLGLGNDFAGRIGAQARACGVRVVGVEAGGLAEHVDSPVDSLTPAAIVAATLGPSRPLAPHPTNEAIAQRMLSLYAEVRRR